MTRPVTQDLHAAIAGYGDHAGMNRLAEEVIHLHTENDALTELQRRFALRLDAAMDALGYPVLKAARVRSLATSLGVDTTDATALMNGLRLPEYSQLLALCNVLRQQPGYFLDEQVLDVPAGTTVVKPLAIGEDLVLRLPSEILGESEARRGLLYWRATVPMGFGIIAGEFLIALGCDEDIQPEPNKLYLLTSKEGINVVQCADVHSDRAVFHTEAANEVAFIVATCSQGKRLRQINKLVASIRCGNGLHVGAERTFKRK